MAVDVNQVEITGPDNTTWSRIDGTPLTSRKYVQLLNQTDQGIGVIFSTGGTPTGDWNTGEQILSRDKGDLEPAEPAIHIYVRTETGPITSGAAIILREWA